MTTWDARLGVQQGRHWSAHVYASYDEPIDYVEGFGVVEVHHERVVATVYGRTYTDALAAAAAAIETGVLARY